MSIYNIQCKGFTFSLSKSGINLVHQLQKKAQKQLIKYTVFVTEVCKQTHTNNFKIIIGEICSSSYAQV